MTMTTMLSELEEELQKNMQRNLNVGFMEYIARSLKIILGKNHIEWYRTVITKDIEFLHDLRN